MNFKIARILFVAACWLSFFMHGIGCARVTKDMLLQNTPTLLVKSHYPKAPLNQSLDDYNGGNDMAGIIVTQADLRGASATLSINHPDGVGDGQVSSAKIKVSYGEESVEAGWTVNPRLYHDDKTRFYTRWMSPSGGCNNTDCPGFVVMDANFPLNYEFPQVSVPGSYDQYEVDISIHRGNSGENWFLTVNGSLVGFWRGDLFKNLNNAAAMIVFIGEVYSQSPTKDSPPMGSGDFENGNPEATAYMKNVEVQTGDTLSAPPTSYQMVESRCYHAGTDGNGRLSGFNFLFGGKGGHDGTTCLN